MDVVYLFKESVMNDSAELRHSLRSLQNFEHGNVYIIGEKPDWATNVVHIPVLQNGTKNANVAKNIQTASETEAISEDFVMMNDDFFIMKPIGKVPTLHWGSLKDVIERFAKRYDQESDYMRAMKRTLVLLVSLGFPAPVSYELHVPMVFNKTQIRLRYQQFKGPVHQFRTFYGNYFNVGGTQTEDVKVFVDPKHNDLAYNQDPEAYLNSKLFLSATGGAFEREMVGRFVREKFAKKSVYEA